MPNRTELGDVPSTISPLQRALDELEASIVDGKAAHRVLADALENGIANPGAPPTRSEAHGHRADAHTLGERFEAVVAQIRYQMPAPAAAARAADLLAMDERERLEDLTRSCDWVDAVRDFLREIIAGRMRPSEHTVTFVPTGVPGVLDGVPHGSAVEMIRGLVRCAELRERSDGGGLWDDESRRALAAARAAGWGRNQIGRLNDVGEAATTVDPTQESVNRQVEHDLTVIAARMVRDYPGMPPRLNLGDLRRMANFVLAHSGEGPVTPPAAEPRLDQPWVADLKKELAGRRAAAERAVSVKRDLAEQLFDAFWGTIVNAGWPMPVAWEALHESQRNAWRDVADAARRSLDQDLTFGAVVGGLGAAQLVYTAPAPKAEASPDLQAAIGEMDSGLNALVNELAPDVVQNLRTRFEDVLRHTNNQLLKPSHELEALRNFHERVTHSIRLISHIMRADTTAEQAFHQLAKEVLENNGQALMKPRQLDAIGVTVKSGASVVGSGTWTETPGLLNSPQMPVTKRPDGAYTVGPPPDGRPVAEHLDELTSAKVGVDWTAAPDGHANSSPLYKKLCTVVERIILESATDLIAGRTRTVAGIVMAQLAHVHKVGPMTKATAESARVIDIARRVVSRGMHHRTVGAEFLHNDIEGMRMLAEAVAALDKEKP